MDSAPDYFIWLQFLSPIKYGSEDLIRRRFWQNIDDIPCGDKEKCTFTTGVSVLKNFSNKHSVLYNIVLLLCLSAGFYLMGCYFYHITSNSMQPSVSHIPFIGCVWQTSGEHDTTWCSLKVTMRINLKKVMFLVSICT